MLSLSDHYSECLSYLYCFIIIYLCDITFLLFVIPCGLISSFFSSILSSGDKVKSGWWVMTHIHFISVNLIKIVQVGIYRPPWLIWDISKYNYYNDNYNGTYTLLPQYYFLLFFLFFHSICSIIWKIKFGWAADKLFFLSRYIITNCVNGLWYSMACVGHTYNQNNIMTICLKFAKSGPFQMFLFIYPSEMDVCCR